MSSRRRTIVGMSIGATLGGILVVAQLVIAAISIAAMFAMGWIAYAIVAIVLNVLWIVVECLNVIFSSKAMYDLMYTEYDD